jgi:hypothetical protein
MGQVKRTLLNLILIVQRHGMILTKGIIKLANAIALT